MLTNVGDDVPRCLYRISENKPVPKLFAAFGWCGAQVQDLARHSTAFKQALLEMTQPRFHLIVMSLAIRHARRQEMNIAIGTLGDMLASHRAKEIIKQLYGFCPNGAVRSLDKLPATALAAKHYLTLLDLLQEPRAQRLLCHADRITPRMLVTLQSIEPPLRRRELFSLLKTRATREILKFLIDVIERQRPQIEHDRLLETLGRIKNAAELETWFCGWIEDQEFPTPPWHGTHDLQPLRSARAVREAALLLKNCLRSRIISVITGTRYYYLRRREPICAVELVNDRLAGWMLCEIKSVGNANPPKRVVDSIQAEFRRVGIGSAPKFGRLPAEFNPNYWDGLEFRWL